MKESSFFDTIKYIFLSFCALIYFFIIYKFYSKSQPIVSIILTILLLSIPLIYLNYKSKRDTLSNEYIGSDVDKDRINKFKNYKSTERNKNIMTILFITGLLFYFIYAFVFIETTYAYHGNLIIIACGIVLSLLITFMCRLKNKTNKIKTFIMIAILIIPMISAINKNFNIQETKTVSVEVINKRASTQRNSKFYFIYVDKSSIPTVKNKFWCSEEIYEKTKTGSRIPLTYKKGLLGLEFVEINY